MSREPRIDAYIAKAQPFARPILEKVRERVHAVVQPRAGATIDLDALAAYAEENLANYKRPRSWQVRDQLPRTESGKLLKRVLRDEHWAGRSSRV